MPKQGLGKKRAKNPAKLPVFSAFHASASGRLPGTES